MIDEVRVKARIDSDDDVTVELRIRKDNLEQLSGEEPLAVTSINLEQREDGAYNLVITGSPGVGWKPTQAAPSPQAS